MKPSVRRDISGKQVSYHLAGEWTVDYAEACLAASEAVLPSPGHYTLVQCEGIERIDITGAWLLNRRIDALQRAGSRISLQGFRPEHLGFLERVGSFRPKTLHRKPARVPLRHRLYLWWAARIRKTACSLLDGLNFIGWCGVVFFGVMTHPARFRLNAFVKQCEQAAVRAAPIVGMISFLIAVVTAYQGSAQLKRFGAEIFSINLVTISVLREMAVLLTAIMLAGRSGSAFAAEIGTMKLNEEIDAIKTTGLDPMEILVLPRILALTLMTPLLTFLADMTGFLGAGVLTVFQTDTNWRLYFSRLNDAIRVGDFWVGMSKAPVFGLLIAMVGCYHGMKVSGSAESVGKETTNAVVNAIFMVLLADALFSILFTALDV